VNAMPASPAIVGGMSLPARARPATVATRRIAESEAAHSRILFSTVKDFAFLSCEGARRLSLRNQVKCRGPSRTLPHRLTVAASQGV